MKFIIGTLSKRKIAIAEKTIKDLLPSQLVKVVCYNASSRVGETPWEKETYEGAYNRAYAAQASSRSADYFVGVESGLVNRYGHIYEEAWCCILSRNKEAVYGYSSGLKVPDYVLDKMEQDKKEHWQIMRELEVAFQHSSDDTWGNYSGRMISRDVSLQEAIRNAIIQLFANEESYYKKK